MSANQVELCIELRGHKRTDLNAAFLVMIYPSTMSSINVANWKKNVSIIKSIAIIIIIIIIYFIFFGYKLCNYIKVTFLK